MRSLVAHVIPFLFMDKTTYADYLATSETFNDWLKQVPFGFWIKGMKVNKDNSVTFIFKNSLDTERWLKND